MRIGLTYDLRREHLDMGASMEETAEFDSEETIAGLESGLLRLGFPVERVGHVKALAARLVRGERFDLVFNIAEGLSGFGREAQVPALLEAYNIPYVFSEPLALCLTLHKGVCKRVVRDLGLPTAPFAVIERLEDLDSMHLPFPLFLKPVAEGTGKGVKASSRVESFLALRRVAAELLTAHKQPVLVETFLPGREFTVGVVGNGEDARVVGIMEILLNKSAEPAAYTFANKQNYEWMVNYRLADDPEALEAGRVALASHRGLGLRDGSRVDLRSDALGQPNFMEVNPLPGLNPEHSDLPILCRMGGTSYEELLGMIVDAALSRVGLAERAVLPAFVANSAATFQG